MKHGSRARLLALGLIFAAGAVRADAQTVLESIPRLLDRYARGDATLPNFSTAQNLQTVRERFTKEADAWIRAGGQESLRKRQLQAASVALEIARASLDLDWKQGRSLIGWGSALLRKGAADEGERLWHLAALSLMQGASDNELLVSQQKEAWVRFDAEPRFLLALVVMLENETWPDPDRGEPWEDDTRTPAENQRRARMRSAITLLEDLSNNEDIRAEALLRLGFLHLRLQRLEIALEQFDDVRMMTEDPYLLYLAHLLSGHVHERQGDTGSATESYRAALDIVPGAQSASVALASVLFVGNQRDEAGHIIARAVAPPLADDPWRSYQTGDFRCWSTRIIELREAVR